MGDADAVARAVAVLRAGGLVALPTETVYGLGADASNPVAVAKIFAVKGRPADHPLIVHIADAGAIDAWAIDVPPLARELATRLWPGPLTLVLRKQPHVDDALTGGQSTIGLRVPAHPLALAVLRELAQSSGGGIAAPSANRFGRVSPTSAQHVRDDLGDAVDYVLDGGPCAIGLESTIVDLSRGDDDAVILRPGGVGPETIARIAGRPIPLRDTQQVRVPGQHASHYAPRARLVAIAPDALDATLAMLGEETVGSIVAGATAGPPQWTRDGRGWRVVLAPGGSELAHHLYAVLRELDAKGCTVIVATIPTPQPTDADLVPAIADRLRRAAGSGDPSA
jgi:L-threonylcarbamoyladenylate synthase